MNTNEVKQIGEIPQQLREVAVSLDQLDQSIHSLATAIGTILHPSSPIALVEDDNKKNPENPHSDLYNELEAVVQRISKSIDFVNHILSRVSL